MPSGMSGEVTSCLSGKQEGSTLRSVWCCKSECPRIKVDLAHCTINNHCMYSPIRTVAVVRTLNEPCIQAELM